MGREARVAAEFDRWKGTGRLLLETDELIFRGDRRLAVARASIDTATAKNGWLEIRWGDGRARFEVGATADRWANDILNPKSRVEKLDVKPSSRVVIASVSDASFADEIRLAAGKLDGRLGKGPYDLIFYGAASAASFDRLTDLRARLQPAGAIWIITPKGVPELGHGPIVAAAKAAGLIDTKTARFSGTHMALKLVIPKADR